MFGLNYTIDDLHHIWDEDTFKNYMAYWNVNFYLDSVNKFIITKSHQKKR